MARGGFPENGNSDQSMERVNRSSSPETGYSLKKMEKGIPILLAQGDPDPSTQLLTDPKPKEKITLSPEMKTIAGLRQLRSKLDATHADIELGAVQSLLGSNHIITIDDGPTEATLEMLKLLNKKGIKAIFYLVGNNIDTPQGNKAVREMVKHGHVIAYHTMKHEHKSYSEKELMDDYAQFSAKLNKIVGFDYPLVFIRLPGGNRNSYANYLNARKTDPLLQKTSYLRSFTKTHVGDNWDVDDNRFRDMNPGKHFYRLKKDGQHKKDDHYHDAFKGKKTKVFLLHSRDADAGTLKAMLF
ncbi:MAG: polysaccharide deacetylase family protein [Candidatus Gracilibacteria bacterium]